VGEARPFTYLCFSSSFICSAISWMGATPLLALEDASGVAPLEEGAALESFDFDVEPLSAEPGTRSGELAIMSNLSILALYSIPESSLSLGRSALDALRGSQPTRPRTSINVKVAQG